ncbi:Myb/SANT-like DNA-binding domain-containing protein 3 [Labeo rohita]|uniref:Myb/SANT-like DNA-binding domain-containing protein 3 n=1 Tax=Labeo rohita TaxID=84645 RepID=A0ABQ8LF71_LABRO|nr:Myb/SANT-like DNA-binding domain-containing protein 3 [Labeo rohita]
MRPVEGLLERVFLLVESDAGFGNVGQCLTEECVEQESVHLTKKWIKAEENAQKTSVNLRRPFFKQIVSNYPVIENKQHDSGTENKKKKAWISILNEFNSNEKVTKRTLQQIQVLWKNIKINLKKTTAATRQECFKTGGGLPVPPDTEELGDLLAGIIESQQPLEGIPDDDHLDSSDDLILTQDLGGAENSQDAQMNPAAASTNMQQQHPVSCSSISQHPAVSNPGSRSRGKRMTIHEKLAIEFHERKLQYLKEEHEVKMKILHLELSMKERDMKQQQCQLSLEPNLS